MDHFVRILHISFHHFDFGKCGFGFIEDLDKLLVHEFRPLKIVIQKNTVANELELLLNTCHVILIKAFLGLSMGSYYVTLLLLSRHELVLPFHFIELNVFVMRALSLILCSQSSVLGEPWRLSFELLKVAKRKRGHFWILRLHLYKL